MSATALSPDLILTNANVLTADETNSRAEAVAVYDGKIGAVGSIRDIDSLGDKRTEIIDLKGRTLLPGLTDPHVHFADGGAHMMHRIDCRDFYSNVRAISQIVENIREQAERQAPGSWVIAHGSPMQCEARPESDCVARYSVQAAGPRWRVARGSSDGEVDGLVVIGRRNDPSLELCLLKLGE